MDYPQLELAEFKGPKAIFETSEGHFEIALFPVSYTHLTLPTILRV